MQIHAGNLSEKINQQEKIYEQTKVSGNFLETIRSKKTDALEHTAKAGQAGYEKEELTQKSAKEEFLQKMDDTFTAEERKKQMSVLANTFSEDDFEKLKKDGYLEEELDTAIILTVVDKIKVQLAKAGADVSNMGNGLTKEQLEAAAGSITAANQLQKSFAAADIPITEKNMSEGLDAFAQAKELAPLSKGAVKYLLDNHLDPSIENLYKAAYAGSDLNAVSQENPIDFTALQQQIEQVITAAGAKIEESTIADSQFMIQNEILFTVENFAYMQKLCGLELPADDAQIADAIALAISEGDSPKDAMLLPEYSLTARAEYAVQVVTEAADEDIAYLLANHIELSVESLEQAAKLREQGGLPIETVQKTLQAAQETEDYQNGSQTEIADEIYDEGLAFIRAKRILEETRLRMTTEANRALLKQGISIETKALEQVVEQLKEQENQYYTKLLGQADGSLFEESNQKVSELKQMPAYVLGMQNYNLETVNGLHEAGSTLAETMKKAGESYETLMTAPRADLGDSIQKAFANVEDILQDLGLESSESNQRAVRILAYNRLDITEESILTMKAADERVQRTFSNLTPAVVRTMIQEGYNPLDMNLDDLNAQAQQLREQNTEAENEKFSEYLWKLEQKKDISADEKEAYIGIYRLLHQIDKSDGAAIGALVSQGTELTMRNLLTAIRSNKKSGMDYSVDDAFAGVETAETKGHSITEQIETAYQANCMKDALETLTPETAEKLLENPDWEQYTPEQFKEVLQEYANASKMAGENADTSYVQYCLQQFEEAANADSEVYRLLEKYKLPNTVDYVLAANRLVSKRNQVFSQLFNAEDTFSGDAVDFAEIQEEILQRFANSLKTPKEMAAAQEVLAETAENVMKTMIKEDDKITSMDIRELKLMCKQCSIAGKMAEEESYHIPVLVGDEVANMSLRIVRGTKQKGMVEIMFETMKAGKVAACISAKENGTDALIAADTPQMKERLSAGKEALAEAFGEGAAVNIVYEKQLDFSVFSRHTQSTEPAQAQEGEQGEYEVQTARLYEIAAGFLEMVKELSI